MKKGCLIVFITFFIIFIIILVVATIFAFKNADSLGATPSSKIAKSLDISGDNAEIVLGIFKDIGIDEKVNIEHDELLDNAHFEGEKGYRLNTNDVSSLILYMNVDETVYLIKYVDNVLYENGNVVSKLNEFTLTLNEKSILQNRSQKAIKTILKSPSTAKFPNINEWRFGKQDGVITIQSYVESQNSFGAMIRSDFQMKIQNEEVISLILDGQEYIK